MSETKLPEEWENLHKFLIPLSQNEAWFLGYLIDGYHTECIKKEMGAIQDIPEFNQIINGVIQRKYQFRDGRFDNNDVPLVNLSQDITNAFEYVTNHSLFTWSNKHKTQKDKQIWHDIHYNTEISDSDNKELSNITKGTNNPLVLKLGYSDIYNISTNKDDTYSINIFDIPLKYLDQIHSKSIAEHLLSFIFMCQ